MENHTWPAKNVEIATCRKLWTVVQSMQFQLNSFPKDQAQSPTILSGFLNKRVLIPQGKPWTLRAHTDKIGEVLSFCYRRFLQRRTGCCEMNSPAGEFISLTSLDNKVHFSKLANTSILSSIKANANNPIPKKTRRRKKIVENASCC